MTLNVIVVKVIKERLGGVDDCGLTDFCKHSGVSNLSLETLIVVNQF